ncbi:MAG: LOG family protein [Candidatus Bathyarchaeota archaeon]|nr:MAG: LOG family protein [Candidatus Bathyarchaeota archaeon]
MKRYKSAAFLGGADVKPNEQTYQDAFLTAQYLAQMGFVICNGGGPGVMRASTEGAKSIGGKVIGVTCYPKIPYLHWEGRDPQNFFDEEIITSDYFERTKQLLTLSDIYMIFKGGTGTISEFGMAWASSYIRGGQEKPIILFGGFWKTLIEYLRNHMYMRPGEFRLYSIVETVDEAVYTVKQLVSTTGIHSET